MESPRCARRGHVMTDRPSSAGAGPDAKADTKPQRESKPEPKTAPESDLPPETEASEAAENEGRAPDDTDEDTAELRRRYLLRRFWHTASRFWTAPGCRVAWLL